MWQKNRHKIGGKAMKKLFHLVKIVVDWLNEEDEEENLMDIKHWGIGQ